MGSEAGYDRRCFEVCLTSEGRDMEKEEVVAQCFVTRRRFTKRSERFHGSQAVLRGMQLEAL